MELSFLLQQEIFFNIKKKQKANIQNNQSTIFLAVNNAL